MSWKNEVDRTVHGWLLEAVAGRTFDRERMAARVFGDEEARKRLQAITHPRIGRLSAERIAAAFAESGKRAALMPYLMGGFPDLEGSRAIGEASAGRSMSSQWKKSTRASEAGTTRPSWLTSSPRDGTSGSWQRSASDFVPAGSPDQVKSEIGRAHV